MSELFNQTVNYFKTQGRDYTILKIAVDPSNQELIQLYSDQINSHNEMMMTNPYSNAGFDLFVPDDLIVPSYETVLISMDVKCEMTSSTNFPSAFYMYPRSSISKTPLSLANSVGIIDSGYRGKLIGAFRSISTGGYRLDQFTRLLQITNTNLSPIIVKMVDESELSVTERGSGGFGSTGV